MVSTMKGKTTGSPKRSSCPSTELVEAEENCPVVVVDGIGKVYEDAVKESAPDGHDDYDEYGEYGEESSQRSTGLLDDFTEAGDGDEDGVHSTIESIDTAGAFGIVDKKESQWVLRSKTLVFFMLVLTAVGFASAAALLVKNQQQAAFETSFHNSAVDILRGTQHQAQDTFRLLASLATTFTSFTMDHADTMSWPYFTLSNFEVRGRENNLVSQALQLSVIPLVSVSSKLEWESFSVTNQSWIQEGVDTSTQLFPTSTSSDDPNGTTTKVVVPPITDYIHLGSSFKQAAKNESDSSSSSTFQITAAPVPQNGPGTALGARLGMGYGPVWQQSPAPSNPSVVNYDILSNYLFAQAYRNMYENQSPMLSKVVDLSFLYSAAQLTSNGPQFFLMQPIYATLRGKNNNKDDLVGFVVAVLEWDSYLSKLLDSGSRSIVAVVKSSQGDVFSYSIQGPTATFMGFDDFHNRNYGHLQMHGHFAPPVFTTMTSATSDGPENAHNNNANSTSCQYEIFLYPTQALADKYQSKSAPAAFAIVILVVFFMSAGVFVLYDCMVQRRQNLVMATAKRTNALVSTFFPSNVRDRILGNALMMDEPSERQEVGVSGDDGSGLGAKSKSKSKIKSKSKGGGSTTNKHSQLKTFLNEDEKSHPTNDNDDSPDDGLNITPYATKPIADLFPHTTIMFADIVGFTAWSSVREPTQVFVLLETLYHAFDQIAKRRRVFKVETVGDCYVAVAGLPDPRPDHAVVMCRFARECLIKVDGLTKKLETTLGPDTGDLSMRFGLHSGPVTAGVLRGDRQRFQLFGDTMNTASRIETTGRRDKIHLSQETADQLLAADKGHWIKAREDRVQAKGKGELKTYWLDCKTSKKNGRSKKHKTSLDSSVSNTEASEMDKKRSQRGENLSLSLLDDKTQRLVDWNVDVLQRLLRQIVARRNAIDTYRAKHAWRQNYADSTAEEATLAVSAGDASPCNGTVIDEVKEIIHLPEFDDHVANYQQDSTDIELDENVNRQLKEFVMQTAKSYRDNPFHNFEHASHVTMSVVKLLSRIVATDNPDVQDQQETLHDHTYGITSDPLTQFACVWAALIHDVEHVGVPNGQLVKERLPLAEVYNNKSVAEQNSVDVSWDLLMDPSFDELRQAICSSDQEMKRFRSLVVNAVMATDIVDKELKAARNARWEKAFSDRVVKNDESSRDTINRKATIVIEHLIQASDVAHTMQHWHVYRKWNERLFHEMNLAWRMGRADKNPADFWYQGELGFFDFYIIPLAKKLKDCGVFGVSSDEYLNYAQKNRQEWELKGQEVTEAMIEKYKEISIDIHTERAKLDAIQDSDKGVTLRSQLLSTQTFHGAETETMDTHFVASAADFAEEDVAVPAAIAAEGLSQSGHSDFADDYEDDSYSSDYDDDEAEDSEVDDSDQEDLELLKEMQGMIEHRKGSVIQSSAFATATDKRSTPTPLPPSQKQVVLDADSGYIDV